MNESPVADRFLARLLRRGIVRWVGGASFVGALAAAPMLFACSCPSWTEWHVKTLPETLPEVYDDETCRELCGGPALSCRPGRHIWETPAGQQSPDRERMSGGADSLICEVRVTQPCGMGRRPAAPLPTALIRKELVRNELVPNEPESELVGPVGAHLAAHEQGEAASVLAFVELARDLEVHGAPPRLVLRALAAARDEIEHARAIRRIRRGPAQVARAELAPPRTLPEVLRDNTLEGVVEEGFGATVLAWQGRHAHPDLRPTFAAIARDELGHARLAKDIAAWGRGRLARAARRRLDDEAVARGERCVARARSAGAGLETLGLPRPHEVARLAPPRQLPSTTSG